MSEEGRVKSVSTGQKAGLYGLQYMCRGSFGCMPVGSFFMWAK